MSDPDNPVREGSDPLGDLPAFQFLMDRWKEFSTTQNFPSCIIVEEFIRHSKEKNDARPLHAFTNWLVLFDEIVNWFSSLALALKREFLTAPEGDVSHHLSVMTSLSTKFAADLCAIRVLMIEGFEIQARIVSRSAIEAVELMLLLPHDPEMEEAFYQANDFEKCNEFWHRYISKGRLRKRVNRMTDEVLGLPSETWKQLRDEHEAAHSILAHPSTLMGVFAMFPDEEGEDRPSHWGYRTNASIMTMRYLCTLCANVIWFNDFIPFGIKAHYPRLLRPNPKDINHQTLVAGRLVIGASTSFAWKHARSEILDPLAEKDEPQV